jgi:hypothetical protein
MGKLTSYAAITTLNEASFFYVATDSDTNGVWETYKLSLSTMRTLMYDTNSNILKLDKGADIASATALVLGTDGNYFDVTGTTTITSISTVKAGTQVLLQFDGALTLTHHATDLVLPGGLNITTAAGDHALFVEYATGDWRLVYYTRAAVGPTPAGFIAPVYLDAAPQALSGAGAVDIVSPITNVTTTGATDALTLADSTIIGQMKVINHVVDGGGYVLTPTTLSGGTTITVTDVSVSITLMWTSTGWRLVSQTGAATIA